MEDSLKKNSLISRRRFVQGGAVFAAAACAGIPFPMRLDASDTREADFYEPLGGGRVLCSLCPHGCTIEEGGRGLCGVRENDSGRLITLVYGKPCSLHLDPIEKKPFYHVLPGSSSLSLSTVGCNMTCKFCQNWQISQSKPEEIEAKYYSPSAIAGKAVTLGAPSIAYTYGEPAVFFEYMRDIAVEARKKSVLNVVVTNGYYTGEAINELCRKVDAIKIDLKAFDEAYYRDICGATLRPVLDSLLAIMKAGIWLEIVYLMIPTLNDDPDRVAEMSRWLRQNLGADVPVHFSRFYPQYRLTNLPPTPVSSLEEAWHACRAEGMRYVYIGNLGGHEAESTYCHACGKKIISRNGYRISRIDITGGKCDFCGTGIPGIWKEAGR